MRLVMASPPVEIASGITSNQVIQQDSDGRGRISVRGLCREGCHTVDARVVDGHGALRGLEWKPIAAVESGNWKGSIDKVPVGGPYRIEFRALGPKGAIGGMISVDGVLVGDLWMLAGQSNMDGRGELVGAETPDERVHNFDLADHWSVAQEPIGDRLEAVDPAHWTAQDAQGRPRPYAQEEIAAVRKDRITGASSAMTFAKQMLALTHVPIGLIPCARGGTSLDKWSPAFKEQGPASLYGSMLRRCAVAGGRVRGMLWYQGESDAVEKTSAAYGSKFREFIQALRVDLRQADLPVYYMQIGRFVAPNSPDWNNVQLAQLEAETRISHVALAPAVDLELLDEIHLDTPSLKRVGRRLANLACAGLSSPSSKAVKRGPRPNSARFEGMAGDRIAVTFSDVNGTLVAEGRVSGFTLRDAQGSDLFAVNDAVLDPERPDTVVLRVKPGAIPASGATLWYGWGNNPYCNLRDAKDMAAPVFTWPVQPH
jgi:sialate O-acetylesterase